MKIIAIAGAKRAGKDSIADILVKNFGYQALAPGNLIREVLSLVTDHTVEYMSDVGTKERTRKLQQDFGVKMREVSGDPDFWIRAVIELASKKGIGKLVIPSIRGEEKFLKSTFTYKGHKLEPSIWFVTRPGLVPDTNDDHAIEQFAAHADPANYDAHIINDGKLNDLVDKVEKEMVW